MIIYFTGFMATGKSRIGEATAKMMGFEFIDTDKFIEARENQTVSEIFTSQGEAHFRSLELSAVREISARGSVVVALGGGTLTQPEAVKIIKSSGILVRLWAPLDILNERISRKNSRPLMAGLSDEERKAKIAQMLKEREPFYSQADFSVKSCEKISIDRLAQQIQAQIAAWNYRSVQVVTPSGSYPIFIGHGIVQHFGAVLEGLSLETEYLLLTDQNVYNVQRDQIRELQRQVGACRLFRFPSGEKFKSLQTLNRLYTFMLRKGYSRKTTLLQFSGGVVGDMAGYGAASYQRGIPFIQIPTTLLSMVDSSVGGKVGVNHPLGKNMIGAFYQPKAVFIDLKTLETLPQDEYLAGLAEVVKYGVIWDKAFFDYLDQNIKALLNRDPDVLIYVVSRCCAIKAEVVSQDEKESGIRAILNYGHTFGHAIEKLTEYEKFSHGIAVSLGMRVAGKLATLQGLWSAADEQRQTHLLNALGMPQFFEVDKIEAWKAMGVDKKADKGTRVFILPTEIGKVILTSAVNRELVDMSWDVIKP